jgi:RecB family exonuclease
VETCPLRWALESAGGRGEDSLVQSLGTLVHEIAAELPRGTVAQLRAALDERWPTLGIPDGWAGRRTRAEAEAMIDRLAAYVAEHPGEVAVEVPFTADVARAHLTGRIDRVERVPGAPDAVRVVDLKTSKSPVSAADGEAHPQLASYPVAVEAGALGEGARSAGARLVYLGTGAKGPTTREQGALTDADDAGWAHEMVARAAETMAGATFTARVGPGCTTCPVRTSCPAQPEGRRTTA